MAYNENEGGMERPMIDVNEKCATCGTEITKLPFEPKAGRPVYCRDCYRQKRESDGGRY